jgi:hypothetical protein
VRDNLACLWHDAKINRCRPIQNNMSVSDQTRKAGNENHLISERTLTVNLSHLKFNANSELGTKETLNTINSTFDAKHMLKFAVNI